MSQSLRERYQQMTWERQAGNLASTLARVANNAIIPEHDKTVVKSLRESTCFIEWCLPNIPAEYLLDLANLQRELRAWWRVWPVEGARQLLALHARHQSDRLLQMAGYYPQAESKSLDLTAKSKDLDSASLDN